MSYTFEQISKWADIFWKSKPEIELKTNDLIKKSKELIKDIDFYDDPKYEWTWKHPEGQTERLKILFNYVLSKLPEFKLWIKKLTKLNSNIKDCLECLTDDEWLKNNNLLLENETPEQKALNEINRLNELTKFTETQRHNMIKRFEPVKTADPYEFTDPHALDNLKKKIWNQKYNNPASNPNNPAQIRKFPRIPLHKPVELININQLINDFDDGNCPNQYKPDDKSKNVSGKKPH